MNAERRMLKEDHWMRCFIPTIDNKTDSKVDMKDRLKEWTRSHFHFWLQFIPLVY